MVLSNEDRGNLERTIDTAMDVYIPIWLPYFRVPENKNRMQYQRAEDVVFGVVWGAVLTGFLPTIMPKFLIGIYTQADLDQIRGIMFNRGDEIRDRIHNFG
jgi:hypothetical protein